MKKNVPHVRKKKNGFLLNFFQVELGKIMILDIMSILYMIQIR